MGVLATVLVLCVGWTPAAEGGATEGESRTFDGHYRWDARGDNGSLEAVFTRTGESAFDVAFHFNYLGAHTYRGTAEGSLEEGKLRGNVTDERGDRSFSFQGTFRKGKFRGTHFETSGGGRRRTGSLSLRDPPQ